MRATVHLHPDEVIAYFSVFHEDGMKYVSNDTALVMQMPVAVLKPDVNVEVDVAPLVEIVQRTNCIVMPQHGITTFGATISEAYHRACSLIAETRRLLMAHLLATSTGRPLPAVADEEVRHMLEIGQRVIYGTLSPTRFT